MQTAFDRLLNIMDDLRENCPWDKKQTIQTLRHLTIEEMYELVDAIEDNNWDDIKEELGDILLHIVFYAKIATEQNKFTIDDAIHAICNKLVARHPHIYAKETMADGLQTVVTDDDVKANWEKLKLKEGKKSILAGVPTSLPSMVKAIRLQEKTKTVGFEWENTNQVLAKLDEEVAELKVAIANKNINEIEDEMGDVFFSLINMARFLQVDADAALEKTNKKFIRRFTAVEGMAALQNKQLLNMSLVEMDELWNSIKKLEKK